jgi:carboxymethylenebutenolidase
MPYTQPDGFLAIPSSGEGRPVLVLHPWWGLNDTMRSVCSQLAAAGFSAFAPDLYHGKIAQSIAEAEALSGALDNDRAKSDVLRAAGFLRERAGVAHAGLAVIGFSLGAYFALDLSVADPDHVRTVVVFYGTGPADYSRARAEYLGHFAETDPYEPPSNVDELEASLRYAGRSVSFYHYKGTGHWFFEPDRKDAFNQAAASLAWRRTLAFLSRHTAR